MHTYMLYIELLAVDYSNLDFPTHLFLSYYLVQYDIELLNQLKGERKIIFIHSFINSKKKLNLLTRIVLCC